MGTWWCLYLAATSLTEPLTVLPSVRSKLLTGDQGFRMAEILTAFCRYHISFRGTFIVLKRNSLSCQYTHLKQLFGPCRESGKHYVVGTQQPVTIKQIIDLWTTRPSDAPWLAGVFPPRNVGSYRLFFLHFIMRASPLGGGQLLPVVAMRMVVSISKDCAVRNCSVTVLCNVLDSWTYLTSPNLWTSCWP